jgi:uncharacterized protein Usg
MLDTNISDIEKILQGHHLTTAEILYHMPDHPTLLQTYIWQEYDYPPLYPQLNSFLIFWEKNLDGKIETVRVMFSDHCKTHSFIMPSFERLI